MGRLSILLNGWMRLLAAALFEPNSSLPHEESSSFIARPASEQALALCVVWLFGGNDLSR
jgi:hypothetical protein